MILRTGYRLYSLCFSWRYYFIVFHNAITEFKCNILHMHNSHIWVFLLSFIWPLLLPILYFLHRKNFPIILLLMFWWKSHQELLSPKLIWIKLIFVIKCNSWNFGKKFCYDMNSWLHRLWETFGEFFLQN